MGVFLKLYCLINQEEIDEISRSGAEADQPWLSGNPDQGRSTPQMGQPANAGHGSPTLLGF